MQQILKVGVFVDAENVRYNGGYQLRYDILRMFAGRYGGSLVRLNTYIAFDQERAKEDPEYKRRALTYQQMVREYGWKVIVKNVRRYTDDEGNVTTKANADLDMAVDAMLQAEKLDLLLMVTGNGDFLQVVTALQDRGCRVELLGFRNVSQELRRLVDDYYSGFLIPDLLPISYEPRNEWGAPGSCVRGVCSKWFPEKGYGFLRFIKRIDPNLWIIDPRLEDSPYESVFCHANELADEVTDDVMMNRDSILEFYIEESDKDDGLVANNVRLVPSFGGNGL
ncbi:MAG: NYN domain-containing protein [Candidatus Thiodiazotropha lotti]|nr:NYN domain-containing protein [Candidatus Thiodiazotropha lotti]MCG8003356.1 NYN domain-containing protein [Candidatus Thiodiazotropha lotti]MCG8008756.1 NYN domain-containing protein [Candidatus Thiodiazotropha lotti]MCW4186978.1 NYN domain-containing protein [Candidatus Thiodiazotropha lotti]MCW4196344.1 NYN domain-containing protein [Candidatus Thiodiazotropha lotti]